MRAANNEEHCWLKQVVSFSIPLIIACGGCKLGRDVSMEIISFGFYVCNLLYIHLIKTNQ